MICDQVLVTSADQRGKCEIIQPGNRELETAIACISGTGFAVPPFTAVHGKYLLDSWYTKGGLFDD